MNATEGPRSTNKTVGVKSKKSTSAKSKVKIPPKSSASKAESTAQ